MIKKIQENIYYQICGFMLEELNLGGSELLIYAILYSFSSGDNGFYGSYEYLCRLSGLSQSTVKRILKNLINKRLIIKHIKDGSTKYKVTRENKRSLQTITPPSSDYLYGNWKEKIPPPTKVRREDRSLYDYIMCKGRPVHEFYSITDVGIVKMTPEQYCYLLRLVGEDKLFDYIEYVEAKIKSGEYKCVPDYKLIKKWILEDTAL